MWAISEKKYEFFDCDDCGENEQRTRNCCNQYPTDNIHEKFRFQMMNGEILYECPRGYFDNDIQALYQRYAQLKTMKELGISINPNNVSLLELDCYNIIEQENIKINDIKIKQESSKVKKGK